jgi:hypothetical protein
MNYSRKVGGFQFDFEPKNSYFSILYREFLTTMERTLQIVGFPFQIFKPGSIKNDSKLNFVSDAIWVRILGIPIYPENNSASIIIIIRIGLQKVTKGVSE